MVTESELEALIKKHFGEKVNKEIYNNIRRIYEVGEKYEGNGEKTVVYTKEIFQKAFDTGMGEELVNKLRNVNGVNGKTKTSMGPLY